MDANPASASAISPALQGCLRAIQLGEAPLLLLGGCQGLSCLLKRKARGFMVGDEGELGCPRRGDLRFQLIVFDDGSANASKPLLLCLRLPNCFTGVSCSAVCGGRCLFRRFNRVSCLGQRPVRPALAIFSRGQVPFGSLEASYRTPQSFDLLISTQK